MKSIFSGPMTLSWSSIETFLIVWKIVDAPDEVVLAPLDVEDQERGPDPPNLVVQRTRGDLPGDRCGVLWAEEAQKSGST